MIFLAGLRIWLFSILGQCVWRCMSTQETYIQTIPIYNFQINAQRSDYMMLLIIALIFCLAYRTWDLTIPMVNSFPLPPPLNTIHSGHLDNQQDVKDRTGDVYGQLWEKFSYHDLTKTAMKIIRDRWEPNQFPIKSISGKRVLDMGCGSGRFSFALGEFGAAEVVGVDYGERGLKVAHDIVHKSGIKNIHFQKANIIDLPFQDESFDFVFSHGTLHHTEDMEQGIAEMVRVTKPGGKIWFYIYGAGGIFWYARKKMPLVMKKIPQHYTLSMLDMLGMPSSRFIFVDNWYVPLERHTTDLEARKMLKSLGINKILRKEKGRSTDLDYMSIHGGEVGKIMWGDGELSYFLEK